MLSWVPVPKARPGSTIEDAAVAAAAGAAASHAGTIRKQPARERPEALAERAPPSPRWGSRPGATSPRERRDGRRAAPPRGPARRRSRRGPRRVRPRRRGTAMPTCRAPRGRRDERLLVAAAGRRRRKSLQPRMSFTLSRNDLSFSCSSGRAASCRAARSSFRCSAVSLVGTTTRTVTWRSPRPRPPRWGTPWPRTRKVVPRLRALGDRDLRLAAVQRRAPRSDAPSAACANADRDLAEEGRALALEERVLLDAEDDVEVAGRAAGRCPPRLRRGSRSWLPVSTPAGDLDLELALDGRPGPRRRSPCRAW